LTFGKSARTLLAKTGPGIFSNSAARYSSAWCTGVIDC
jgi:hypothetical protein